MKLSLHPKQHEVFSDRRRFRVLCCGRRFGKSRLGLTEVIQKSLTYDGPYDPASPPVVLIGLPNLPMAKRIFFRPLADLLQGHPLVAQINRSESIIHLKGDRPDIVCLGLNDGYGDRVRGLRIWGFIGDEIQATTAGILDEVIMPAMADTLNSWALLTGTPKGKQNHLFQLTQRPNSLLDWAYYHFLTSDNPFVSRAEIERARATLDPRIFRQEYEASFETPPGQVYTALTPSHLIKEIPEAATAFMGIDFGDMHPAIVVAILTSDRRYVVVETWENNTGLPIITEQFLEQAVRMAKRWKIHRAFCDPSRPAAIMELRRAGKHANVEGLQRAVKGFNRVNEGCQIVNNLFHANRLLISEQERSFFEEMQSYHRETDDSGLVLDKIEDGQRDHRSDSCRYLCATLEFKHDLSIKTA